MPIQPVLIIMTPFRAVPVGDVFQCKIDKIFSDMPNVFGIADNFLVTGYDEN